MFQTRRKNKTQQVWWEVEIVQKLLAFRGSNDKCWVNPILKTIFASPWHPATLKCRKGACRGVAMAGAFRAKEHHPRSCFHLANRASFHSCKILSEVIAQPWAIPKLTSIENISTIIPPYTCSSLSCPEAIMLAGSGRSTLGKSKPPGWWGGNFKEWQTTLEIFRTYTVMFTPILKLVFSRYNLLDKKGYFHVCIYIYIHTYIHIYIYT